MSSANNKKVALKAWNNELTEDNDKSMPKFSKVE